MISLLAHWEQNYFGSCIFFLVVQMAKASRGLFQNCFDHLLGLDKWKNSSVELPVRLQKKFSREELVWLRNSGEIELSVCKLWLTRCCQPRWLHFQWNHLKFWNRGMSKCNNVLSARINQNHKFQGSHLLSMLKIGFHVVGFSWHLKICHDYALCPCDSFWRLVILALIFHHKCQRMPQNFR